MTRDLQTATEGMRNLLQRNGLYLAKVDPKSTATPSTSSSP